MGLTVTSASRLGEEQVEDPQEIALASAHTREPLKAPFPQRLRAAGLRMRLGTASLFKTRTRTKDKRSKGASEGGGKDKNRKWSSSGFPWEGWETPSDGKEKGGGGVSVSSAAQGM